MVICYVIAVSIGKKVENRETPKKEMIKEVWVFNGASSNFPSGVFVHKEIAESWIKEHKLTGVLTLYPINKGVYDWAIDNGMFTPKKDSEILPSFIQKFTSASQEHYHYENGILET